MFKFLDLVQWSRCFRPQYSIALSAKEREMAAGFKEIDDSRYADLVPENATNPLFNLKPSALNLTTNCWATGDMLWLSKNPGGIEEPSRLQTLSNDLRTSLPPHYGNTSTAFVNEYLETLQKLPNFVQVLGDTFIQCNATDKLHAPVSEIDFTKNCFDTGNYWWHLWALKPRNDSLRLLLRVSMPEPYATMSNMTLRAIAQDARSSTSRRNLRQPIRSMLDDAARTCAPEACLKLDFEGNADIAGIGVM